MTIDMARVWRSVTVTMVRALIRVNQAAGMPGSVEQAIAQLPHTYA